VCGACVRHEILALKTLDWSSNRDQARVLSAPQFPRLVTYDGQLYGVLAFGLLDHGHQPRPRGAHGEDDATVGEADAAAEQDHQEQKAG